MKRAVILAAGIGSRLRPITEYKPKTLVQVNGKPILAHTIDALLEGGITSIVIVTGYLSESVRKFCQDAYPDTHFTFIENDKFDTTNNLYSLYLARHYLTEDSIVMNGDLVFDSAVIKRLKTAQGTRVAVDAGRFIDESMKVVVRDGIIRHISKKVPHQDAYGCSIDIYKFTKSDLKPLVAELEKNRRQGNPYGVDGGGARPALFGHPHQGGAPAHRTGPLDGNR